MFPAARDAYRKVFRRAHVRYMRDMADFYGQFWSHRGTVFDVGANQGEYSEMFASRGARVIAIEPNPGYADRLAAISVNHNILPVMHAIGAEPGKAVLNICSTPGYSTLLSTDSDWIAGSPDYAEVAWTGVAEVEINTIDQVARKFGLPDFIKIDIEGFELSALQGMTFDPRYLSFEFGARRRDLGIECLRNMGARGYTFRPITGRDAKFVTDKWMDESDAIAWLSGFTTEQAEYGDMFCRSPATTP
ncbi:MAG TPA: FkbM family methyltransferase [Phenylobacterium sp.]|nr:FkbM family methyltransferase [Phenylobacterium sp.]